MSIISNKLKVNKIKLCKHCYNEFTPINNGNTYCSLECRFWNGVDIRNDDECWPWVKSKRGKDGYGSFTIDGVTYLSHRFAWEQNNGLIPDGKIVCHKCDFPACCNTKHHFLGTKQDNSVDRNNKGRHRRVMGSDNPSAKLNESDVLEIRNSEDTQENLANKYNVSRRLIRNIKNRSSWKHL